MHQILKTIKRRGKKKKRSFFPLSLPLFLSQKKTKIMILHLKDLKINASWIKNIEEPKLGFYITEQAFEGSIFQYRNIDGSLNFVTQLLYLPSGKESNEKFAIDIWLANKCIQQLYRSYGENNVTCVGFVTKFHRIVKNPFYF